MARAVGSFPSGGPGSGPARGRVLQVLVEWAVGDVSTGQVAGLGRAARQAKAFVGLCRHGRDVTAGSATVVVPGRPALSHLLRTPPQPGATGAGQRPLTPASDTDP